VFPTTAGKRDNPSNVRNRFLANSVERANVKLGKAGEESIGKATPRSLRRTFASLLLATGADVPYVMAQLGHTDPKMTLGVYAKVIASKTDHAAGVARRLRSTPGGCFSSARPPEQQRRGTRFRADLRAWGFRVP
jgi:integrase